MSEEKPKKGRPPGKQYPARLPVYDTEQGKAMLLELARRRKVSAAQVVRDLVREEAKRVGLIPRSSDVGWFPASGRKLPDSPQPEGRMIPLRSSEAEPTPPRDLESRRRIVREE